MPDRIMMADPNDVPWSDEALPRPLFLEDAIVPPQDIALYVHCRSGMAPLAFVAWLCEQLDLLASLDPDCSK